MQRLTLLLCALAALAPDPLLPRDLAVEAAEAAPQPDTDGRAGRCLPAWLAHDSFYWPQTANPIAPDPFADPAVLRDGKMVWPVHQKEAKPW